MGNEILTLTYKLVENLVRSKHFNKKSEEAT